MCIMSLTFQITGGQCFKAEKVKSHVCFLCNSYSLCLKSCQLLCICLSKLYKTVTKTNVNIENHTILTEIMHSGLGKTVFDSFTLRCPFM